MPKRALWFRKQATSNALLVLTQLLTQTAANITGWPEPAPVPKGLVQRCMHASVMLTMDVS